MSCLMWWLPMILYTCYICCSVNTVSGRLNHTGIIYYTGSSGSLNYSTIFLCHSISQLQNEKNPPKVFHSSREVCSLLPRWFIGNVPIKNISIKLFGGRKYLCFHAPQLLWIEIIFTVSILPSKATVNTSINPENRKQTRMNFNFLIWIEQT